ncbi:uncharacterized protein EI97DRAFT_321837 [Westerdykella ornata]|uniref:Uncharacterized protein n=1 Tax=Westerdykella ornata TaxID=318751 RepID=A0A6A6JJI2_WESOR|nr:uncharacterized protein EI97DRAFT_321837 [Westerdykella ornata]KAF2276800.1 hypothetical protein EI97DRAFT_321837 [Westerdykella ornata]
MVATRRMEAGSTCVPTCAFEPSAGPSQACYIGSAMLVTYPMIYFFHYRIIGLKLPSITMAGRVLILTANHWRPRSSTGIVTTSNSSFRTSELSSFDPEIRRCKGPRCAFPVIRTIFLRVVSVTIGTSSASQYNEKEFGPETENGK